MRLLKRQVVKKRSKELVIILFMYLHGMWMVTVVL